MTDAPAGLYAYALLPADSDLPDLRGVGPDQPPVRRLRRGDLAVLVSDVDTKLLESLFDEEVTEDGELARWALAHDAVVRAAFARSAVLPFRLGTVLRDRSAAERLLTERHDAAIAVLARLRDRVEWGIRGYPAAPAPAPDTAAPADSGTAYLAGRRDRLRAADEHRERVRDAAAAVRDELAVWAADVVDRPGGAPLDIAVLVDRTAEDEFHARTEGLATRAAEAGLTVDVTGPWPPYSFARTAPEMTDA